MSIKKLTLVIIIASITIPLSFYSNIITPLTILVVALYCLYLENKIKIYYFEYRNKYFENLEFGVEIQDQNS
jgi:hypothetical protein